MLLLRFFALLYWATISTDCLFLFFFFAELSVHDFNCDCLFSFFAELSVYYCFAVSVHVFNCDCLSIFLAYACIEAQLNLKTTLQGFTFSLKHEKIRALALSKHYFVMYHRWIGLKHIAAIEMQRNELFEAFHNFKQQACQNRWCYIVELSHQLQKASLKKAV